jgi:hypothetical protein
MVFNVTFNIISVISWRSVFIGWRNREYPEKTNDLPQVIDVSGENQRPATSHWRIRGKPTTNHKSLTYPEKTNDLPQVIDVSGENQRPATSHWRIRRKPTTCHKSLTYQKKTNDLPQVIDVSEENQRPATSHWQTLWHNVISSNPRHERDSNSPC